MISTVGTHSGGGGRIITQNEYSPSPGGGGKPDKPSPVNPKGKGTETQTIKWHKTNPCPCAEWQFPSKTATKVFFPSDGGFNQKLPHFSHHVSGKQCALCLKYQTNGECIRGAKCSLCHVPPDKMPKSKYDKINAIMLEQKKIAKDNGLLE